MDVQALATAILHHAVQLTLLACLVWCFAKLFAKNRPHLAHALWILVLVKCVVPPAWSSPTSVFNLSVCNFSSGAAGSGPFASDNSAANNTTRNLSNSTYDSANYQISVVVGEEDLLPVETVPTALKGLDETKVPSSWYPFAKIPRNAIVFGISVLAVGFAIGLLLTCGRLLYFLQSAYSRGYYSDSEIDEYVRQLARRLGVKRHVSVRLLRNPIGPVVLGLHRPTLLLPELIVRGRKFSDLEPLIAHELIHIRRGDLWWSMLQTVATNLWWFHPLVSLAGRMVSRETERSCDEETVASLGCSPAVYARSLLDVLERKHQLQIAPALPGVKPIEVTLDRMERIMKLGQGCHKRAPRWIWAAMFIGCAIALPNGSVGVAQDANVLATTSQVVEAPPKANEEAADPLRSYREDVGDLIDTLKDQGKTADDARGWILGQLPLRQDALTLVHPERLLGGRMRTMKPLQQILDRELRVSGTVSEVQEIRTKLRSLRETCKKQVSCEVKTLQFTKDEFTEISANWSLTRINPDGVRTVIDGVEEAVARPNVDGKMKAALEAAYSQLGLAFALFDRPSSYYTLNDEELDAILKRKDIQQAPRVTGRSGQTVTMTFQLDSKADDNERVSQGTSLELTPTLIEGARISLRTKYSNPSINKERPWNDTGSHGKRVLEAMRVQNPSGRNPKNVTELLALAQYEQGKFGEAVETLKESLVTYPDSEHQFLTTEAQVGKTHVICLPTQVEGEVGVLTVLVKCSVVDPPKAGTSATFDKPTADAIGFVNVGGAVKKPDRYELDKPTTVAQAIVAAGGLEVRANLGSVFELIILRQVNGVSGHIFSTFILDSAKLGKEATQADKLWLKQNDIVFVKPTSPTINSAQAKELFRAYHAEFFEVVFVIGPITAGLVHEIPPIEHDEALHALSKISEPNGRYAFGSGPYSHIEIEKISESKDDKRFIPLIGEAVLHHTYYMCTIHFKDSDKRREVLIDHNHFHVH